jgi:RNA polymerase sigma factor (sigma-70 family)
MVTTGLEVVVRHVRRVAAGPDHAGCTDPELLRQFTHGRDEAAFAAIVRRHGPMVMRVCRHVLRREQDAEDAFQVTFLVLARSPRAIRKGGSLASWLHGVAYRTALTARRTAATRQRHEARAEPMFKGDVTQEIAWREVQAILDAEVQALPEVYRTPFVLCEMEGRSRAEAAHELGIKEGTVSSRLDRAHKRLRERLVKRGVTLAPLLATTALTRADGAAVSRRLLDATVRAGLAHAAGSAAAVSESAAVLLRAVTRGVGITRGKAAIALLAAALVAVGAGTVAGRMPERHGTDCAVPDASPAAASDDKPAGVPALTRSADPARTADDLVTLSGQVLDPDNKPAAGAEVTVRWQWLTGDRAVSGVRTKCGPDGRFRLRFARADVGPAPLPPHPEPYQFAPLQVVVWARGYGPGWVQVERGARGEELTLRLARDDVPIRGRVLDIQLRPVTDATVRVLTADWALSDPWPGLPEGVKTDREGRFVLTGVGRDRAVRLSVEGPTIEQKTVEVSTRNASTATVEVVAGPTRVIQGTIGADHTGTPLAGVVVRGGAQHGRFTEVYTLTDARGHYRLVGLPKGGSYEVTAWPNQGQNFLPKCALVSDSQGLKPLTADFRLERGIALRVRLVDQGTGKPVRGIVHYDPLASNGNRPRLIQNGTIPGHEPWQFGTRYPDKDGYVHFVIPPGPGVVVGAGHDTPYLTRPLDPADVRAYPELKTVPFLVGGLSDYPELFQSYRVFDARTGAKPLDVDILLDPGREVQGRLVGPDGKPLTGAIVYGLAHIPQKMANWSYRNDPAYRARIDRRTLETDRFSAAGFTLESVRTVTFLHTGRKLIANVVLRADHKGPLTVRLEPWGAVTGRVVDTNGKPVAGLAVSLLYPSQDGPALLTPGTAGVAAGLLPPGWPLCTDAGGRFRVEGLIPGPKHQLTFTAGVIREVSTRPGEVRDLGDICVGVPPPGD